MKIERKMHILRKVLIDKIRRNYGSQNQKSEAAQKVKSSTQISNNTGIKRDFGNNRISDSCRLVVFTKYLKNVSVYDYQKIFVRVQGEKVSGIVFGRLIQSSNGSCER